MEHTESFAIIEVDGDRTRFMPLLLIGDESESMIDRYIGCGNLYVGFIRHLPMAVCLSNIVDDFTVEVKNLAVLPEFRRRGFGRRMLQHVESLNPDKTIILGTGETPSTLHFYRSCGFSYSHRIRDFFTDNYPAPIVEEGVTLRDMIYLKKHQKAISTNRVVKNNYLLIAGILSAALLTVACTDNKKTAQVAGGALETVQNSADANLTGQWYIEKIVLNDSAITLPDGMKQYFLFTDSAYSVMTNCNSMSGSVSINGDSIRMADAMMTELACDDMSTEDALRQIVPEIATYRLESDSTLTLCGKTGNDYVSLRKARIETK